MNRSVPLHRTCNPPSHSYSHSPPNSSPPPTQGFARRTAWMHEAAPTGRTDRSFSSGQSSPEKQLMVCMERLAGWLADSGNHPPSSPLPLPCPSDVAHSSLAFSSFIPSSIRPRGVPRNRGHPLSPRATHRNCRDVSMCIGTPVK